MHLPQSSADLVETRVKADLTECLTEPRIPGKDNVYWNVPRGVAAAHRCDGLMVADYDENQVARSARAKVSRDAAQAVIERGDVVRARIAPCRAGAKALFDGPPVERRGP